MLSGKSSFQNLIDKLLLCRTKPQKATKGMNARDAFVIAEITEVSQHRYVDAMEAQLLSSPVLSKPIAMDTSLA